MKERPILFSGPMVKALLEGRKVQTRRVVKPYPSWQVHSVCNPAGAADPWAVWFHHPEFDTVGHLRTCPYGQPGDRLWVRETFFSWRCKTYTSEGMFEGPEQVVYRADGGTLLNGAEWRPSIHMPRIASRLTLELTDVRVQRLQEMSGGDAEAEGIEPVVSMGGFRTFKNYGDGLASHLFAIDSFASLWDSINGDGSWASNPWVWALSFKIIEDGK